MTEHDTITADDTMPALALVVIRSTDLVRVEAFYSALGLTVTRERHGSGPEHLVCVLGTIVFEIYPRRGDDDATSGVRLGFVVPALDGIDAAVAAGGKLLQGPGDSPRGRRALLADPDGHRIELIRGGDPRVEEDREQEQVEHDPLVAPGGARR